MGGGNCLKYLERGWNKREGRGNKDFKKGGGQAGIKGGLEPPYELCDVISDECHKHTASKNRSTKGKE